MAPKKVISQGRRILRALLLSGAFLLIFSSATAQAALQFDVFLGYDGVVPANGWFPIVCELHNDGPSFNAVVEVSSDSGGQQSRQVPVELPTNTRKRICIPVYSSSRHRTWNVRLLDDRGKVRSEQTMLSPRRVMVADMPVVAAISRTVGGVPPLPTIPNKSQDVQPVTARLQPAIFPDNPLALEGIDLLYLSSEKALELSEPQVAALTAWLQRGGHLVVSVEQTSDLSGVPWLKQMLPCELTGTANLQNHEQLVEWTKARDHSIVPTPPPTNKRPRNKKKPNNNQNNNQDSTPVFRSAEIRDDPEFEAAPMSVVTGKLTDGHVLIGDEATPLVIEATRVRGKITVLTFSPEREPFVSWKSREWFWAKMANIPLSTFESPDFVVDSARLSSDGIFGAMIDSKQIRKLPLGWLLLLLLAYLVVIGPLDQYWLKKINRQMWTWVTFPLYVVIFSGLIYLIGFHLRAGELEWNELNIVDVLQNGDFAVLRGQTYVSIYSPVNSHYSMASDQPFATLRGEYQGNFGGGQESSRASVVQKGNSFRADVFVPVWTSQLYVSDWLQPGPVPLTLKAVEENGKWKVTVENKTDRIYKPAHVVLGRRVFDLGDLPANQTKTFALDSSLGQTLAQFMGDYGDKFRGSAQARRQSFGNNGVRIEDVALGSMAASFLSQANRGGNNWDDFNVPESLDLTRFAMSGQGILLAWDADHSMASPINKFNPRRIHRNSLVRLVVPEDQL